jgi:hypothetical protein
MVLSAKINFDLCDGWPRESSELRRELGLKDYRLERKASMAICPLRVRLLYAIYRAKSTSNEFLPANQSHSVTKRSKSSDCSRFDISIRSQRLPSSHPIFLIIQQIPLPLCLSLWRLSQSSTPSRRQRRSTIILSLHTLHSLRPTNLSLPPLNPLRINLPVTLSLRQQHRHTNTLLHLRQRINPLGKFRSESIISGASSRGRFRA